MDTNAKLDIDTCETCQQCKEKQVLDLPDGFSAVFCPSKCSVLSKLIGMVSFTQPKVKKSERVERVEKLTKKVA